MAISRISAHSAQATSVAITTPTAGDLILVFAHRDGSTTAPTLVTGYTNVVIAGANTNSARCAYKFSDGTETTSGTWTSATSVAVGVYRGVDPNTPFGAYASAGSTVASGATMSYPVLTMFRSDNTSWVVGFGAGRTVTNCGTNAPSGMGTRSSATDIAIFDTDATVSSWSAQTATVTASSTSGYRTNTVELIAKTQTTFGTDPLIQAVSTLAQGQNGNGFVFRFPNQTLANNCLVIAFTHTHGITVSSVTDSNSTAWTAGPTAVGDGSTSFRDARLYYLLNAPATDSVTVTFSANAANCDCVLCEFKSVATSSAVDGTATGAIVTGQPLVKAGSITTTQAGDLVFNFAHHVGQADAWDAQGMWTMGITADSGFALIAASRITGYGAQYGIQAASGAIDPALIAVMASGDTRVTGERFASLSIAFKIDGSGTARPAGIRIIRIHTDTGANFAAKSTFQFPCTGNLLVGCESAWAAIGLDWSSCADSNGNTWVDGRADSQAAYAWYTENATTNTCLNIKTGWTYGGIRDWVRLYDITGAATASFDTKSWAGGTQSSAGADITVAPTITPTTSNGLIIACGGMSQGPSTAVFSPSGALYDNHIYTGETDFGWMNNGDINAHYYNPNTSAASFSWHMSNPGPGGTVWMINAMAFKAPSAATSLPKSPTIISQAVKRAATY